LKTVVKHKTKITKTAWQFWNVFIVPINDFVGGKKVIRNSTVSLFNSSELKIYIVLKPINVVILFSFEIKINTYLIFYSFSHNIKRKKNNNKIMTCYIIYYINYLID